MTAFLIDGLDRTGKSTLTEGIQNALGYHLVIHYGKPLLLDAYKKELNPMLKYQKQTFKSMFDIIGSGAPVIFDRTHLGECVYGSIYRGYDSNYVFDLERHLNEIKLILLIEDFDKSKHFIDDGQSLGAATRENRKAEQDLFLTAFERSKIKDKRIICVTQPDGQYRSKDEILQLVIS